MIVLRDEIQIQTSPETLFGWLSHLPENYLAWHPDHRSCRYVRGRQLDVGSILEVEEVLHGRLHRMRFHLTQLTPDAFLRYRIERLGDGYFAAEPLDGGVRFVAAIRIGTRIPVLDAVLDLVLARGFRGRIEALRRHMTEEGQNLKRLLEGTAG